MYLLIEIVDKQTNIDLFETREDVEREMKNRYTKLIKESEKIDWKRTWFDEENLVARVDDYKKVTEYRECMVRIGRIGREDRKGREDRRAA